MATTHQKRSRHIHLLMLGAATLAASGCQHLDSLSAPPASDNTSGQCQAYWGEDCLREVDGLDSDGVQQMYWEITPPLSQAELTPDQSSSVMERLLSELIGRMAGQLVRVIRGGFGHSASRFGGAHA